MRLNGLVLAMLSATLATGCDSSQRMGNGQDLSAGGGDDLSAAPDDGGSGGDAGSTPDLTLPSSWSFGGGWHPPDAGTHPASNGGGGSINIIGSGADASSPTKFGGAASGSKPTIVYPDDGVVVPPNMNALEIHFTPAAGETLFEITFQAPTYKVVVYTGCSALGGGCVYATDAAFWAALVPYARGTAPVTYSIKGVNGATPGTVGTSTSRSIVFGQQDITAGLYYWNTAGVIERYDWGLPNVPPKAYLTPLNTGAAVCVGCHVVARDGDRIMVGKDIPAPAPYTVFDVATTLPLKPAGTAIGGGANFASFSPDGQHLLFSDGAKIGWQELISGSILNPQVVSPGTMPDWSPDGTHMVYAKPANPLPFGFPAPGVDSASIASLHFNGATWDTPTTLVPFSGANNYYPTYAPTGEWVVFNRSPSNANSFSNGSPSDMGVAPDGELWAVAAAGGAPVRLSVAATPGNCQWPKWAPVLHDYYAGKIMWLTFSSNRAYGLRQAAGVRSQLWMIGFDPAKAAAGADPSLPAFWLPFQDLGSGNHIAQWATSIVRKPCNMPSDCDPGDLCRGGICLPQ